jgi:hypothetical protein
MNQAIRLRTGIRGALWRVILTIREAPAKPHLHVMLMAKRAKFFATLDSRHGIPLSESVSAEEGTPVEHVRSLRFLTSPRTLFFYARAVDVSRPIP